MNPSPATLGKSLSLFKPKFLHLYNVNNHRSHLIGFFDEWTSSFLQGSQHTAWPVEVLKKVLSVANLVAL